MYGKITKMVALTLFLATNLCAMEDGMEKNKYNQKPLASQETDIPKESGLLCILQELEDRTGEFALLDAIKKNDVKCANKILACGIDINRENKDSQNILDVVAHPKSPLFGKNVSNSNQIQAVKLLLNLGAYPFRKPLLKTLKEHTNPIKSIPLPTTYGETFYLEISGYYPDTIDRATSIKKLIKKAQKRILATTILLLRNKDNAYHALPELPKEIVGLIINNLRLEYS